MKKFQVRAQSAEPKKSPAAEYTGILQRRPRALTSFVATLLITANGSSLAWAAPPVDTTVGTPTLSAYQVTTQNTQYGIGDINTATCAQQFTNAINQTNLAGIALNGIAAAATVAGLTAQGINDAADGTAEEALAAALEAAGGSFDAQVATFEAAGAGLDEAAGGVVVPLDAGAAAPGLAAAGVSLNISGGFMGSAGGSLAAAGAAVAGEGGVDAAAAVTLGSAATGAASGIAGVADQAIGYQMSAKASGLPNCDAEFTGTITADANIKASQGISADNGQINLGDPDGHSVAAGITLGGGALSGAGFGGAVAETDTALDIAIGNGSKALGVDPVGPTPNTVLEQTYWGASAPTAGSVAFGTGAYAANGGLALGDYSIANGTNFSVAVGPFSESTGNDSTALGFHARALADDTIALGADSEASAPGSVVLGVHARATGGNSVALGYNSVADENNTVSVGTRDPGGQRRITNVAAGYEQYDAVNFGQFSAAVVGMAAAPSVTTPSAPGKTTFNFNSAYFEGQTGFGVGLAHRLNINIPTVIDATVSEGSSREWIARAGFSVEF